MEQMSSNVIHPLPIVYNESIPIYALSTVNGMCIPSSHLGYINVTTHIPLQMHSIGSISQHDIYEAEGGEIGEHLPQQKDRFLALVASPKKD